MARGVSENFLQVAGREERHGKRTAMLALALVPAAAFLAELADAPAFGPVWMLFLGALGLGLLGGWLWERRRLAHYADDLRVRWNHVMHEAAHAARLGDVDRLVHQRDPLPAGLASAAAVAMLALNLVLVALLWVEHAAAAPLAWAVLAADGAVLGVLATSQALLARWVHEFGRTARDMVRRGELPIWGER